MRELLFTKNIDKTLFKSGTTLPINVYERLQEVTGKIDKGQQIQVSLTIENEEYASALYVTG